MNSLVSVAAEITPCAHIVRRLTEAPPPRRTALGPAEVWAELAGARLTIVRHGVDESEAWLELEPQLAGASKGFTDDQALVAQRVLCGRSQKTIMFELGVSPSLVSTYCSQVLRRLGVACSTRRVPLALAMVAVAHRSAGALSLPAYRVLPGKEPDGFEVRMSRPESALRAFLSPAEYETVRNVFAGLTYEEVGGLRRRSPRTVANQLRSVTSKLHACGRLQLIRLALALANGGELRAQGYAAPD